CAIFDAEGGLIANAPHMPVHLGSMGESIKMVIKRNRAGSPGSPSSARGIRRGDVYVLNDPYHGGTHLPDITVVTPVFEPPGYPTTTMAHRRGQDTSDGPSLSSASGNGDEIWFYVASRGHHAGTGAVPPGPMRPSSPGGEGG